MLPWRPINTGCFKIIFTYLKGYAFNFKGGMRLCDAGMDSASLQAVVTVLMQQAATTRAS
jgi:hypothetical protein